MKNFLNLFLIGLGCWSYLIILLLKLLGLSELASWPWLWILSPIWVCMLLTFCVLLFAVGVGLFRGYQTRRKRAIN